MSSFEHSNLKTWKGGLGGGAAPSVPVEQLDALDREAVDNALRFAADHARRYAATGGADDGWEGPRPILLLYTRGRRSGQLRRNPLLYVEIDGRRHVIGSKGGDAHHPAWYLNLVADAHVHVRVMDEVYEADARTLSADERAVVWPEIVTRYPMFGDYEQHTDRVIPVVELVRRAPAPS